ncbi:hypothetical protein GXP67_25280 [Rhodocytophaga rosea]|uniref:Lipoprotein n=1 Tax=Rhodocytophaga rosea TaxID=2704465 RepID=A0A6C0GQ68_9BACT|nr:hypothetical protein [Rhodocytophaga rosea]QHT69722.1 hypothetical protein GXP67_25280 [Rhodocytophaga rosea]
MKPITYSYFLFVLTSIILSSCGDSGKQTSETTASTDTTEAVAKPDAPTLADGSFCYRTVLGKDSVLMHLKVAGNIITGGLNYDFAEKDRNTGTISGEMRGDTLLATYTFMSEGQESQREVAFLKKGEEWVEGYGESKEDKGKMIFVNTSALDFTSAKPLTKTDCQEDSHGCVGMVGYTWSTLQNECILPYKTATRLNAGGEAGSKESPAFVHFSTDKAQAELFLPGKAPLLMERKGKEGNQSWENGTLKLIPYKGYVLKEGDKILYAGS